MPGPANPGAGKLVCQSCHDAGRLANVMARRRQRGSGRPPLRDARPRGFYKKLLNFSGESPACLMIESRGSALEVAAVVSDGDAERVVGPMLEDVV